MAKMAILVAALLLSLAAAQFDCGDQPCDRPDIIAEDGDYNFLPDGWPINRGSTSVRFSNSTYARLAMLQGPKLVGSGAIASTIDISVGEITAWLQSGATNAVEAGLLSKVNDFVNSAGLELHGGSLVYKFQNGQEMILDGAGSCSDVTLLGGWNAEAVLKPGFTVKFTFSVDGLALKIGSQVVADTAFAMHAQVKVRKGVRVFTCIRPIVKTAGLDIGANLVLEVVSNLEVRPSLVFQDGAAVIGLAPTYCLRGTMRSFEPTSKAKITIFGIHLTGLERNIEDAIKSDLQRAFTTAKMNESFRPAAEAIQNSLVALFSSAKIVIPGVPQDIGDLLNAAIGNINTQQDYICSGRRPPRPDDGGRRPPRPTPTPGPSPRPTPGPGPRPIRP